MKRLIIAALLGGAAAVPAQAAEMFTLALGANVEGQYQRPIGVDDSIIVPIAPMTVTMKLTGSWEGGFNSWYVPCVDCLKPTFAGSTLILQSVGGSLPCYCSERIELTFDQPFNGELDLLNTAHLVSGVYSFNEGTYAGSTELHGTIFAASVPEPATWAMMIGGFALAGAALRRRRTTLAFT